MYISVDVGGTNTRVAGSANLEAPVFTAEPLRRRNTHDFNNDLSFIIDAALQAAGDVPIEAVGIGTPGSPNDDKTRLKSAKNLSAWVDKPLVAGLSDSLHCPVFYDNDVIAAGLGEAYYGHKDQDFDYVIWGTGIGGGSIKHQDGRPMVDVLSWRTHFADWENDAGGSEITKTFGKPPEELTIAEWETIAEKFTHHLTDYVRQRKPRVVVFGGGLSVKHADMLKQAGRQVGIQADTTEFGDDSGLMGGFGLIKQRFPTAD